MRRKVQTSAGRETERLGDEHGLTERHQSYGVLERVAVLLTALGAGALVVGRLWGWW